MSFTCQSFLFFCLMFFPLFFMTKQRLALSHYVIVVGSCIFYGWWDWRFVGLFGITTCFDYAVSQQTARTKSIKLKQMLVAASIAANLAMLGLFKYFNFLFFNLKTLFAAGGLPIDNLMLTLVLPVGISFYTFQSMSYVIDVYRGQIKPSHTLIEFLAYVSFFPHMIAGPIQKSTHFLPQFRSVRRFDLAVATDGLMQIAWGLTKKVVIADNLAPYVEEVFAAPSAQSRPRALVGAIFFAFQIYCDFSGYADIAIGLAKIMGFNLSLNFAYPYFATSIQDFWRRWHISLTSWFREYVYVPLGGNETTTLCWARNVAVVFVLSGAWHGANWTFIVWGALHAAAYLASLAARPWLRVVPNRALAGLWGWAATMAVVVLGWIFFRAASVTDAMTLLRAIFRAGDWRGAWANAAPGTAAMFGMIGALLAIEWLGRRHDHPFASLRSPWLIGSGLVASAFVLALLGAKNVETFIYFQL